MISLPLISRRIAFVICLGALTSVAFGAPPVTGRAYFYTEPGFQGECFVLDAGGTVNNLASLQDSRGRPFNDRVRSVHVEGPVRVAVFQHAEFRGAIMWFNRDTPDLARHLLAESSRDSWDRNISSIQVEATRPGAVIFLGWDRRDAERIIRAAYRDFFGRDPDETGLRLYRSRLVDAGWSEEQLRDALRRSDEFKSRDLDAIIRRVYREVLGREADASGLAAYRRGLGRGMTEGEMRVELGRSKEARELEARGAITRAYRELLRRDPDSGGLDNYTHMMVDRGWSDGQVREALRRSDEFRKLRNGFPDSSSRF